MLTPKFYFKASLFLVCSLVFSCNINQNEQQVVILTEKVEKLEKQLEQIGKEEVHLGAIMGNMHYFLNKSAWAAKEKNVTLSKFYLHELEETVEDLIEKSVIENGVAINQMLRPLKDLIEQTQKDASTPEALLQAVPVLIRNCNNCHVAHKKEFIVIKAPDQAPLGQEFKPLIQ